MGLKSRNKGKRGEREVVLLARQHGLEATRTWELSQSPNPEKRRCDVIVAGLKCQVKVAANGYSGIYAALEGVDVAFVRCDRQLWLAVLPADRLLALLALWGFEPNPATPTAKHRDSQRTLATRS